MRDDLFKRISAPPAARKWVRMSAREADARSGRTRAALEALVRSECDREISAEFLKWFAALDSLCGAGSLFSGQPDVLERPSGRGGPLEYEVLTAVTVLMNALEATAEDLKRGAVESLGRSIRDRLESYIRAAEAAAYADRDPEAMQLIEQMREDARRFDADSFANKYLLNREFRESHPKMPPLSLDEDLIGLVSRSERDDE